MGADGASVEDHLEALFAAAPEDFVASRDELVRRLRAAGDAATARQVKALRRPTVSASIVNALARAEPELLRQLADVGDALRAAEASLDGAALRQISGQRRALVDGLVRTAVSLAEGAGTSVGAETRGEVQATLDAALAAPEFAAAVASGRLERPLSAVGFGLEVGSLGSAVTTVAPPRSPGRGPVETAAERRRKAALEALAAAEEANAAAESAAGLAGEALAAAETERAELRATLEELRERVADAERRLAEATLDVRSLTAARDRADRTAERARGELARRRAAVEDGGASARS